MPWSQGWWSPTAVEKNQYLPQPRDFFSKTLRHARQTPYATICLVTVPLLRRFLERGVQRLLSLSFPAWFLTTHPLPRPNDRGTFFFVGFPPFLMPPPDIPHCIPFSCCEPPRKIRGPPSPPPLVLPKQYPSCIPGTEYNRIAGDFHSFPSHQPLPFDPFLGCKGTAKLFSFFSVLPSLTGQNPPCPRNNDFLAFRVLTHIPFPSTVISPSPLQDPGDY